MTERDPDPRDAGPDLDARSVAPNLDARSEAPDAPRSTPPHLDAPDDPRSAPPIDLRSTPPDLDAPRSPTRLRVLVVDDHDVVHWGFRLMLTQQPWVERCLSASCGAEAIALASRYEPHVALVDLFIGEESGAEICEQLRAAVPSTRVLLFSGAGAISAQAARAAGASGFASKDWSARRIATAILDVGRGKTVFQPQDRTAVLGLSERERTVLELMASGATNPEIAAQLHLSRHTVKEHTSAVYRKLEVRNRTEAVQRAQRLGLVG